MCKHEKMANIIIKKEKREQMSPHDELGTLRSITAYCYGPGKTPKNDH
jgi:hypothetical protein